MTTPTDVQTPSVQAHLHPNGTATVVVDGHHNDVDGAGNVHQAVVEYIATNVAAPNHQPVPVTVNEPGNDTLTLLIHPAGNVDVVETPQPPAAPTPTRRATVPPPPPPVSLGATAPTPQAPQQITYVPPVSPAPGPVQPDGQPPRLQDMLATRPRSTPRPAEMGWQGTVRRATGGVISPKPSRAEVAHRDAIKAVQRQFAGPRTIVFVNTKGGSGKTTGTMATAATFGTLRGGSTLAWDNNETRGTLGWRSLTASHSRTAVDLLANLERFADPASARVGDLDEFVRNQGDARFDVLASDEDGASQATIDAEAFKRLHTTLGRFYRVIVVDTGNNMRAENWAAAVAAADQLVIVSTIREDTAQSAAWLADALRDTGRGDLVTNAVTVLGAPSKNPNDALRKRLHDHFGALTRAVVDVPYDVALEEGGELDFTQLSPASKEAWLHVSAAIADGL